VDRDRDGLDHGGMFEGKVVGDFVSDSLRNGDVLCKGTLATELIAGYPEDLAIFAEIDRAGFAIVAFATGNGGVKGHAIADRELCHLRTNRGYDACRFVSHDQWGDAASGTAIESMNVAAADSAFFHLDFEIFRATFGFGQIGNDEFLVFLEQQSFH
jgi:hypothetical protein